MCSDLLQQYFRFLCQATGRLVWVTSARRTLLRPDIKPNRHTRRSGAFSRHNALNCYITHSAEQKVTKADKLRRSYGTHARPHYE